MFSDKGAYPADMSRLTRRFEFYLRPKPPYNFELTVHKPAGWSLFTPFEVFDKGTLWTAFYIEGALTGLKLCSKGTIERPLIQVQVYLKDVPTIEQKETIERVLAGRLSVDEDLGAFYLMARKDPILRHTVDDLYGMHDTDPSCLFSEAVLAILLQMAALKRSEEMMECMIKKFGEPAEFNNKKILVWPTPRKIAAAKAKDMDRCKLGYRAKYVRQLASVLKMDGALSVDELKRLDPDEAKRRLLKLPGIGDYSADIVSPHGGFPIDAWSADVFGKLFFGDGSTGRGGIGKVKAEGISRWGKFAWMAFLYVVHDLRGLSEKLAVNLRLE